MRRVLPGGATLGGSRHESNERPVACRPLASVVERTIPRRKTPSDDDKLITRAEPPPLPPEPPPQAPEKHPATIKQLSTVKLVLEVLIAIVGLIGAILALFGIARK